MTIEQLINEFIDGAEEGTNGSKTNPGNLKIDGNKLIHYSTTIAERNQEGLLCLNLTRYSIQTGRIQKQLKEILAGTDYKVVTKIPRDYSGSLFDFSE